MMMMLMTMMPIALNQMNGSSRCFHSLFGFRDGMMVVVAIVVSMVAASLSSWLVVALYARLAPPARYWYSNRPCWSDSLLVLCDVWLCLY